MKYIKLKNQGSLSLSLIIKNIFAMATSQWENPKAGAKILFTLRAYHYLILRLKAVRILILKNKKPGLA